MSSHSTQHDDFLLELMGDSDDPRQALAKSAQGDCPACKASLEAYLATESQLAGAAEHLQDTVPDDTDADPELAAKYEKIIRQQVGAESSDLQRKHWAVLLTTAAAILLLVLFGRDWWNPGRSAEQLGPEDLRLLAPAAEASSWAAFTWQGELPPQGWYSVEVWQESDDGGREVLGGADHLQEPSWTPADSMMTEWPEAITWEVSVFNSSGELQFSSSQRSSLHQP
jgi:hypothetical protein